MKKKWRGLLGLLLAATVSLTACGGGTTEFVDEAVLKIDGQDIMKSEYMVYLYTATQSFVSTAGEDVWNMDFDGKTADELLEERTISTLQSVKAAEAYAEANGIAMTEEEKEAAKVAAAQFYASASTTALEKMGMDEIKLVPLMEASYLYTLVHQAIASECEVDAAAMEAYHQENKGQMKIDYTTLNLQTILLDDLEKAEEAAERAKAGEDFAALFAEYDIAPDAENGGEISVLQNYLQGSFGLTDELEVGEVTEPLLVGENGYFVLKAVEKIVPTDDEVKELAESLYRAEVQTEYTETRFNEMMNAQTVEKVEDAWDRLETFH